jgi:hypothetical protein
MSYKSKFSEDEEYKKIEEILQGYVVVVSEEADRERRGFERDPAKINLYHYGFINTLNRYINSFEDIADKKTIAGNFLHRVADKLCDENFSDFESDGLDCCSKIIMKHPLSNEVKKSFAARMKPFGRIRGLSVPARNILKTRDPNETSKKGKKVIDPEYDNLYQKIITNPSEYCKTVDDFVIIIGCFYRYAEWHNNKDVPVGGILDAIKSLPTTQSENLFGEFDIRKKALLEVVKGYARSVTGDRIDNNARFDNNMKNMFIQASIDFQFNNDDVEDVKRTLITNCDDKEFASKMAKDVALGYIAAQKKRTNQLTR